MKHELIRLTVEGMTCDHCAVAIAAAGVGLALSEPSSWHEPYEVWWR